MADQDYELEGEYPNEIRYFNQELNETWYEAWMRIRYMADKSNMDNIVVCELVDFYLRGLDDETYNIINEETLRMDSEEIFDFMEEFIQANEFVYVPKGETEWKEEYETAETDDLFENRSHTQPPESREYQEIQDSIQILNTDEMEGPQEEGMMEHGDVMSEVVAQGLEACHQLSVGVDLREDGYMLTHSELNYLSLIIRRPVVGNEELMICSSLLGKVCDDSFDDINIVKHILQNLEDKSEIALEKRKLEGASATFLFDNCLTVSKKRHVDSPGNPVLVHDYKLMNWVSFANFKTDFMDFKMNAMDHENEKVDMVDVKGWVNLKVEFTNFSPYSCKPPEFLCFDNVNEWVLKTVGVSCFSPFTGKPPDILIVGAFKTPPW